LTHDSLSCNQGDDPPAWFEDYRQNAEARIAALERQVSALQLGGTGSSSEGDAYRRALSGFFSRRNPEMIPKISKLLAGYSGKEQELFDKLSMKYGEPVLLDVDAVQSQQLVAGAGGEDVVRNLVAEAFEQAKQGLQVGLEERLTVRMLSKFTTANKASWSPSRCRPSVGHDLIAQTRLGRRQQRKQPDRRLRRSKRLYLNDSTPSKRDSRVSTNSLQRLLLSSSRHWERWKGASMPSKHPHQPPRRDEAAEQGVGIRLEVPPAALSLTPPGLQRALFQALRSSLLAGALGMRLGGGRGITPHRQRAQGENEGIATARRRRWIERGRR